MKKLKRILLGNGSLTLLSIISLILLLVIVCTISLSVIYKKGGFDLPFSFGSDEETVQSTKPVQDIGNNAEPSYSGIDYDESIKTLFGSFPYYDDLYAEFYITYIYESYNVEFYRVYKHGECYRVETYDMQNNLISIFACDGKVARSMDINGAITEYPVSEAFSAATQLPLPSFLFGKSEEYVLTSRSEQNGELKLECEFPVLGTKDVLTIDTQSGIMKSAMMYLDEKVIMFYDIVEFESDFVFDDSVFSLT